MIRKEIYPGLSEGEDRTDIRAACRVRAGRYDIGVGNNVRQDRTQNRNITQIGWQNKELTRDRVRQLKFSDDVGQDGDVSRPHRSEWSVRRNYGCSLGKNNLRS